MPVVFDSSALLAIAFDESGAEVARTALKEGILSAVNASEVVSRFVDLGVSEKQAREWLMKNWPSRRGYCDWIRKKSACPLAIEPVLPWRYVKVAR